MLATILLTSILAQTPTQKVALENGAKIEIDGRHFQYWGASDTFLDGNSPNENNGDSHVLEGGPSETILLKFGDLEQLGRHKVVKATLYLTPSAPGSPHLSSIRAVTLPWSEGPMRRPFFTNKALVAADWSATYKQRHAGVQGMDWQQNGASGPGDATTIDGAKLTDNGKEIAISGLEGAVQKMLDSWYSNNGFAMFFTTTTEFFSSRNSFSKPRLELELADEAKPTGPDLSVTWIEAKSPDGNWPPQNGAQVTYVAHVKNVGDAAAQSFAAAWNIREHLGSSVEVSKVLAPNEETTVEMKKTWAVNTTDHRQNGIGLLLTPKGDDATVNNNYLEIQENAIRVKGIGQATLVGRESGSQEDGIQKQMRSFNSALAESKFSFAPEGVLERFRFEPATEPEPTLPSRSDPLPLAIGDWGAIASHWLQSIGLNLYDDEQPRILKLEGHDLTRDSKDRWPGLLGGGSTPNDISVPGEIQLPYSGEYNEIFDQYELVPTGLLAATDVATLNNSLGKQITRPKLPGTVLIHALNSDGDPLPSTELRFYQTKDGNLQTDQPAFRLITGDSGTVLLPNRTGSDGKSDQFGGLAADGSNGVYLVAATVNGVTDTAWIKSWQLMDSYSRTGKPATFVELRFNVPYMNVDSDTNLAAGKAITDSEASPAEKLNALADGDASKLIDLPNKVGDWIEIDLGKDQTVSEIELLGKDPTFWNRFDIMTYFTGETIKQASPFAHEVDFDWNLQTRPQVAGVDITGLVYRGVGRGVRYIRLVCRIPGPSAKLGEIKVFGTKAQ